MGCRGMADEISMETVIGQLRAVLKEGFEGPKNQWSYFTEAEPESGLFGTLGKLSAAEASRPWGGTTIAAHAHHVGVGVVGVEDRVSVGTVAPVGHPGFGGLLGQQRQGQ